MVQLALFTLSFFYLASGSVVMGGISLKQGPKAPWWWLGILSGSGLAISVLLVGGLFRLLLWEGDRTMLVFGTVLLATLLLVAVVLRLFWRSESEKIASRDESKYEQRISSARHRISFSPYFRRALVGLAVGLTFLLTPKTFWAYHLLYDQPEYRNVMIEYMNDPGNPQKQEQLQEYRDSAFGH